MAKSKKKKSQPVRKRKNLSWIGPALLFIGIVCHLAMVIRYNFTQDDAFITFRYAANFVDGHGLVFNIGERVEGYTNFLWTIIMILGRLLGANLEVFSRVIGAICSTLTIGVMYLFGRDLFGVKSIKSGAAALILGTMWSFAYWAGAGLETAAFTLMVLTSLLMYTRRSLLVGPLLILATLLRPEGGLVFIILAGYEIISRRSLTGYLRVLGSVYIVCLIPYAAFKLYYFGGLLPNPFYAKTSMTVSKLLDGLDYAWVYFWHYMGAGLFLLPVLIYVRKLGNSIRMLLVFFMLYTLYIVLIGGDVLKVHRFYLPLMPVAAILVVAGISRFKTILGTLAVIVVIAWQLWAPFNHNEYFHVAESHLIRKMQTMTDNLKATDNSNFSLAVSTIGRSSYNLLGHTVIDMLGLTDTTIARHPGPPVEGMETTWKEQNLNTPYLLSRQPDYIFFSTGGKPSAPAERDLFLHSKFFKSYYTIAFFFGGFLHDIFKRHSPIDGEIERDIDVRFVQLYNQGLNDDMDGNPAASLKHLKEAEKFLPDSVFSYVYYYQAQAYRKMKQYKECVQVLNAIVMIDSLNYQVFKDLYILNSRMVNNPKGAALCRERLEKLMPWYVDRLDSLAGNI